MKRYSERFLSRFDFPAGLSLPADRQVLARRNAQPEIRGQACPPYTLVLLGVVMLLAVTAGCKRQETPPQEQSVFDPQIDAPPSVIVVTTDENLLGNQKQISSAAGKRTPPAIPKPSPARATGIPEEDDTLDELDDAPGLDDTPADKPTTPTPRRPKPNVIIEEDEEDELDDAPGSADEPKKKSAKNKSEPKPGSPKSLLKKALRPDLR